MPAASTDEFATLAAAPRWSAKQRAILAIGRTLAPPLIVGLGGSLRLELPGGVPPTFANPAPAIYVFWHRCLLPVAWIARGRGIGILISQHFDGEIISQAAAKLGYRLFRGSSTRGGSGALQDMIAAVAAGNGVGLTVDGPRGPRFVAKGGAIQLARATGAPIYAIHVSMPGAWTLKSWDRFQIPKPRSRAIGVWSGPLFVPRETDPGQAEVLRVRMEAMLNNLRSPYDEEMT